MFVEQERRGALADTVGEEDWGISVITVSELLHGVHRATGATRIRRQAWVEVLLAGAEAVPITTTVARVHAEVWASLAEQGLPIGQNDLWIGATALTHGFGVVTRNEREFARIPGLRVLSV